MPLSSWIVPNTLHNFSGIVSIGAKAQGQIVRNLGNQESGNGDKSEIV